MARPYIDHMDVQGIKGAGITVELTRLNAVFGANGAGKTRVSDALSFLLGRLVSGEEYDGRRVLHMMSGDRMRVRGSVNRGDDANPLLMARSREMSPAGTVSKSVFYADRLSGGDAERYVKEQLGDLTAAGGPAWLELSDKALLSELAKIGALTDTQAAEMIASAISSYSRPLMFRPTGHGPTDIEAGHDVAKAELKEARAARQAAEKSMQQSAKMVEMAIDPGIVERRKALSVAASDRLEVATRESSDAESRYRELAATRRTLGEQYNEMSAKLKAAKATIEAIERASKMETTKIPTDAEMDNIAQEMELASDTHRQVVESITEANAVLAVVRESLARHESAVAAAKAELSRARKNHEAMTQTAEVVKRVPCGQDEGWIGQLDSDCQPVDLCGSCPLLEQARQALQAIKTVAAELNEAAGRVSELMQDESRQRADMAAAQQAISDLKERKIVTEEALKSVQFRQNEASKALRDNAEAIRVRATADADRANAEAVIAEMTGQVERCRDQVRAIDAALEESREAKDAAAQSFADAKRKAAESGERLSEAMRASERAKRLAEDELLVQQCNEREAAANRLLKIVEAAEASLLSAGQKTVQRAAQPFLDAPWEVAFEGGRVGLRSKTTGAFWSGSALSAAQRIVLGVAIDYALMSIYDQQMRIVMVEIDQIDHAARAKMLGELAAKVASGEIGQVIVMGWDVADMSRPYFKGWNCITVESERTVEALPPPAVDLDKLFPAPAVTSPAVVADPEPEFIDLDAEDEDESAEEDEAETEDDDPLAGLDDMLTVAETAPTETVEPQTEETIIDLIRARLSAVDGPMLKTIMQRLGVPILRAVEDRRDRILSLCQSDKSMLAQTRILLGMTEV